MYHSTHVEVRGQLVELVLFISHGSQRSNSGLYLLVAVFILFYFFQLPWGFLLRQLYHLQVGTYFSLTGNGIQDIIDINSQSLHPRAIPTAQGNTISPLLSFPLLFLSFFEAGSLYIALAVLELTM